MCKQDLDSARNFCLGIIASCHKFVILFVSCWTDVQFFYSWQLSGFEASVGHGKLEFEFLVQTARSLRIK